MTDLDSILVTAHCRNIHRYKRLLRTHLTDLERSFVLRRMNEEELALTDLLRKRSSRRGSFDERCKQSDLDEIRSHAEGSPAMCSATPPRTVHAAQLNMR